jgi:hypothetical protein
MYNPQEPPKKAKQLSAPFASFAKPAAHYRRYLAAQRTSPHSHHHDTNHGHSDLHTTHSISIPNSTVAIPQRIQPTPTSPHTTIPQHLRISNPLHISNSLHFRDALPKTAKCATSSSQPAPPTDAHKPCASATHAAATRQYTAWTRSAVPTA